MTYKLSVEGKSIEGIAGNLSWSSDSETLGQSLSFEMPFDKDGGLFPTAFIEPGNKVTLRYNSDLVFFGVVVDEDADAEKPRKYTCFDLAFYLNKSSVTMQFNNVSATVAIEELCKKFNIKCAVTAIPTKIKKIYKSTVVSEVLKDILTIAEEKTGNKYRFEMQGDTLVIFMWKDRHVKVETKWISNPKRSRSIENMKNSIEIVSGDEKKTKLLATAKDDASIKKYGLLQESHTIDDKEKGTAKTVAANLLKELNRIQEEGSVSLLGNYEVRAGRLITIKEPYTGLQGDYYIKNASHTISNGIHLMNLSLGVVE